MYAKVALRNVVVEYYNIMVVLTGDRMLHLRTRRSRERANLSSCPSAQHSRHSMVRACISRPTKRSPQASLFPHTYLDGTGFFTYLGSWAVGVFHSTATLSSEEIRGLYGLRVMHRLNISLSCFGPRAGQAIFFGP